MKVQRDGRGFTVDVSADGDGVVSHAGAALLAEVADRVGLTQELSRALAAVRERRGRHDPGRVIRDLAVMLADGGDCLSDLRAVRDQQPLFGSVASDSTAFRLVDRIANDPGLLDAVRTARARARERAWELGVRPEYPGEAETECGDCRPTQPESTRRALEETIAGFGDWFHASNRHIK